MQNKNKKRGGGAKIPPQPNEPQDKPSEATPKPVFPADSTENGVIAGDNAESGADGSNDLETPDAEQNPDDLETPDAEQAAPPDVEFFDNPPNIVFVGRSKKDETGKTRRVNLPLKVIENGAEKIALPTATTQIERIPFYLENAATVVRLFGHLYKIFKVKKGDKK